MAIRVLGSTAVDDGALSPRDRAVLAALAVRPGLAVASAALAEATWAHRLPDTWPKQLQATVSRLRRLLGRHAITTAPDGYALDAAASVDWQEFERGLVSARLRLDAGEPERAVDAYQRALALWRGPPFADLPDWPAARDAAGALEELRRSGEEELQAAHLACGEHRSVLGAAEQLVRDAPLRESRWHLLALANYRSGRQAEALATLRAARRTLADELGIEPGPDLVALETGILRQDPGLLPPRRTPPASADCPYRGLAAFTIEDAAAFHGRRTMVRSATARLERSGFLALIGASGCGKSSVALAGVGAALGAAGWSVETVVPTGEATRALDRIAHDRGGRRLLIVDQFEEVFQLSPSDRDRQCALIASAADAGVRVLLTLRSDFLDRAASLDHVGARIAAAVLVVTTMSRTELHEAIETPALDAGLRLEAGLTELLLRDADGESSALPLLSHALVETWSRREGSVLTVSGYEDSGGIAGAVGRSADSLYRSLDPIDRRLCRDIMLRLVEPGLDGQPVRRRLAADMLADDPARRAVVARLTGARLVSADADALVITHEAVATAWPQLRAWLEEDADDARAMRQLSVAAHRWATDGERPEDLLRGSRLTAALEWQMRADPVLTATEARFLDASAGTERAAAAALVARSMRDRRQNHRLSAALAGVAALLVLALAAGSVAVARSTDAARSATAASAAREDAAIEALLGTSLALRGSERDVSALLAATLWQRWPEDARARSALMGVVTASGGLVSTRYLDVGGMTGTMTPTGQALTVEDAERLVLRDPRTGGVVLSTAVAPEPVAVAASGDGARAAVLGVDASGSFSVTAFSLPELEQVGAPVVLPAMPRAMAIDGDGATIAMALDDGAVSTIDVATGALRSSGALAPAEPPQGSFAAALAFTASGAVVLGTSAPELLVLDPRTLEVSGRIPVPERSANNALVRVADGTIVGSGELSTVAVDPERGEVLWARDLDASKPTACLYLAASAASGLAYCADAFGGVSEHSLTDGSPTGRSFDPQLGEMAGVSLTADGAQLLVIGKATPTLSLFRTDGGGAVSRVVAAGHVAFDGFGLDGSRIVVAERPADAVYDTDMTAFSVWDPALDRAAVAIPDPVWGTGWLGDDLIIAFRPADERFVLLRASTGESVDGGPVPPTSERLWPSPSGARAYLSMEGGSVGAIDGRTGALLPLAIEPTGGRVRWISASADDSLIAVTRELDGTLRTGIFDGDTGALVVDALDGPGVTAFGDDELFAAADNRITRHDLGTLARTGALPGARGEVNGLQVGADGATLLATANDETVTLYDVASGRRLGDPIPADAPLIAQGFLHPDGDAFLVNVAQGVQLWDARPQAHVEAACLLAGRELTDEEWQTYLSWLPDRQPVCADIIGAG
ncbi:BTAD domain-containing putative transcriptional regulator [Agrococcus jenensis]|uniref:nSTAND1 domain-containing NTPase n=1 Tax=Agrococcus jenensis TaxID=46353 RepID=UPI0011CE3519|nr:BTAD domain-containing putative transcriptional regulator [Agrococcus jenensis]